MIIRKNAKTLSVEDKRAFVAAVLGLKHRPSRLHPDDATRSRYDDFVEVHLNAMDAMMMGHVPNWGHLSAAFGPWHRVLLNHFETELRLIEPTAAIPYWDWTDNASTQAVFTADLLGGNGRGEDGQVMDGPFAFAQGQWPVVVKDDTTNPSFLTRRFGSDPSATALPTDAMQSDVMALGRYDESPWYDNLRQTPTQRSRADDLFRFRLEYDLHNLVHRYIGGHMVLAASPNDPVFWLHHCNLDRLWSTWETAHAGTALPYEPVHNGPSGQSGDSALIYHFASSPPPWLGDSKPQDVYDSRSQLGVGYDTDVHGTAFMAFFAPALREGMTMPPAMMYPLRSEFHTAAAPRTRLFALRSEWKAQP